MKFSPEPVPLTVGNPELQEYLFRELSRIGNALEQADVVGLSETTVEPDKPREGDIVYADGTAWNPTGEGQGFYGYVGSAWVKLDNVGVGGAISVTNITASGNVRLTNTNDVTVSSTNHAFQVGPDSAANIVMDSNEIMARNNGAVSQLFLNNDGGVVSAGVGGFSTTGPISGVNGSFSGTLGVTGASTFTGTATFNDPVTINDNSGAALSIVSNDAGAAAGPVVILNRDSASPAVNDILGSIAFNGKDSAGNVQTYAYEYVSIVSPTNGSEVSSVTWNIMDAGVDRTAMALTANPTGGFTGVRLSLVNYNADAAGGPWFELRRDSASPANSDVIGVVTFKGNNASAALVPYVQIYSQILDTTAGSEDAQVVLQTMVAGANGARLTAAQGVQIGAPTGGDPGVGNLNAVELRQNGVAVGSAQFVSKAWVNFNGTGTLAVRDSYNVSSVTDNAAGRYTVNFTNAMANANYAAIVSCARGSSNNDILANLQWDGTYSTTAVQIGIQNASNPTIGTGADASIVNVVVFGD